MRRNDDKSLIDDAYASEGRVTKQTRPWGDGGKKRTRYVYNANSARFYDNRPVKVYTDYQEANSDSWLNIKVVDYTYETTSEVERTTSRTYAAGVSFQQVTIEESYGEAPAYAYAAGKPKFSQDISGVQTYHEYEATTEHGAIHKHISITKANGALVAAQSRKTEEFIAADGTTSFEQESIWNGTEWLLLNSTAYEYDEQQRVVKTTHGNGRFSTTSWMCCGRLSETDEDGITTGYGYNSAHQLEETIRSEVKDGEVVVTPETITTYTRDAAGRTLTTRRDIGAMTTTESTAYDALGRVISQTDILGRVTTTTYSTDGLTTTTTTPAGSTTITQRNLDGSTARISGTAQREVHYSYTRNGNNLATTVSLADGSILSQNITNGNGQTIVTATPNTLGGFIYTRSKYNTKGQLTKQYQDTGSGTETTAPTLYEYDSFGNISKQTLALSATPTKDNSPVSMQKSLVSNLSDAIESKNLTIDERSLTSTQWVEYHNGTKRKTYNSLPTSDITAETVSVDGFTLSQTDNAEVTTTAGRSYTASGMIQTRTDGRGNTTSTVTDIAGRTYTPYGSVTEGANGVYQPIRWSSEYNDTELGLVYYNYRHYNPMDGRWLGRDKFPIWRYVFLVNTPTIRIDMLGLYHKNPNRINCIGFCNDGNCSLQPGPDSLRQTLEQEGWDCSAASDWLACPGNLEKEDVMAVFINIYEANLPIKTESVSYRLVYDIYGDYVEIEEKIAYYKMINYTHDTTSKVEFVNAINKTLSYLNIMQPLFDAPNIWNWGNASQKTPLVSLAPLNDNLRIEQLMRLDYHGALKQKDAEGEYWEFVSHDQAKTPNENPGYKTYRVNDLSYFISNATFERYNCKRSKCKL